MNRVGVLRFIRTNGEVSLSEIVQALGLSKTAISELTDNLLTLGLLRVVQPTKSEPPAVGRPATRLSLDPAARTGLGVLVEALDDGRQAVSFAIANFAGNHDVLPRHATDLFVADPDQWIARLTHFVRGVVNSIADTGGRIDAICLGMPGIMVDRRITFCPRIPFLVDRPHLLDEMEQRLGRTVIANNDAALGALATLRADPAGPPFAFLLIKAGVGAAIYQDNNIYGSRQRDPDDGEIGHVTVWTEAGPAELEELIGIPARIFRSRAELDRIAIQAQKAIANGVNPHDPNRAALEAVDAYARHLLTTLNIFKARGCHRVIVSFPSSALFEVIQGRVQLLMQGRSRRMDIEVRLATTTVSLPLIGAALDAVGELEDELLRRTRIMRINQLAAEPGPAV